MTHEPECRAFDTAVCICTLIRDAYDRARRDALTDVEQATQEIPTFVPDGPFSEFMHGWLGASDAARAALGGVK